MIWNLLYNDSKSTVMNFQISIFWSPWQTRIWFKTKPDKFLLSEVSFVCVCVFSRISFLFRSKNIEGPGFTQGSYFIPHFDLFYLLRALKPHILHQGTMQNLWIYEYSDVFSKTAIIDFKKVTWRPSSFRFLHPLHFCCLRVSLSFCDVISALTKIFENGMHYL